MTVEYSTHCSAQPVRHDLKFDMEGFHFNYFILIVLFFYVLVILLRQPSEGGYIVVIKG